MFAKVIWRYDLDAVLQTVPQINIMFVIIKNKRSIWTWGSNCWHTCEKPQSSATYVHVKWSNDNVGGLTDAFKDTVSCSESLACIERNTQMEPLVHEEQRLHASAFTWPSPRSSNISKMTPQTQGPLDRFEMWCVFQMCPWSIPPLQHVYRETEHHLFTYCLCATVL